MSSMAMRAIVTDCQREREAIVAAATVTQWSWRRFRYISVTIPREEAENTSHVNILDYIIENPGENETYASLNALCITAVNAEQLVPGGQVFVSTKDFSNIAPFIDRKERYDAVHNSVSDSGDSSD